MTNKNQFNNKMNGKENSIFNPLRVMPNNSKVEDSVIGTILTEAHDALNFTIEVCGYENPFYSTKNKIIYDCILKMRELGMNIDAISVFSYLKNNGLDKDVATALELMDMTSNSAITKSSLVQHVLLLVEKMQQRKAIEIGYNIASIEENDDPIEKLEESMSMISEMLLTTVKSDYDIASNIIRDAIEDISVRKHNSENNILTGVSSGFKSLDEATGGWSQPDLVILAARPSVGKTALALSFAINACYNGKKVAFFSLEMSKIQLMNRVISNVSKVEGWKIRDGRLSDIEMQSITQHAETISNFDLFIDDSSGLNYSELRAKISKMKQKHGLDLVIIDYLQLMSGISKRNKNQNREQEISTISRELKKMAKDFEVPIIALSQLSRGIESRANLEPKLSDLRESGAIEQDADIVAFLSRPDYGQTDDSIDPSLKGKALIQIRKNRNGALADIVLESNLKTFDFYEPMQNYGSISVTEASKSYEASSFKFSNDIDISDNLPF